MEYAACGVGGVGAGKMKGWLWAGECVVRYVERVGCVMV